MIEDQLLQKIFLTEAGNDKDIQQLILWNKNNKPPMSVINGILEDFLVERNNHIKETIAIADRVLDNLLRNKANTSIIRAYFHLLKEHGPLPEIIVKRMAPMWKVLPVDTLQLFFETTKIKQSVTAEQVDQLIQDMIQNKRFDQCLKLSKVFGKQQKHINALLKSMETNQAAGKAATIINSLGLKKQDYPEIKQRLMKKCMRYFLKKEGWEYVQQLYQDNPQILACAVEDLFHGGRIDQAMTILKRRLNNEIGYLKKPDIVEQIKEFTNKEHKILDNPLAVPDAFGPSDSTKHLRLLDFGTRPQDIMFIDEDTPNLQDKLKRLFSNDILGFDTQSLVGTTKLDETEGVALIQVASAKEIGIFDGLKINSPIIRQYFRDFFLSDKIKVGHSVRQDLKNICKLMNMPIQIERVRDVWGIFKGLHPQDKYSNLSHISKKVIGKEICKQQTLTNWKRRPLRQNQIHYAAMDAFIVLKIHDTLIKEYGQQYLSHFIQDQQVKE